MKRNESVARGWQERLARLGVMDLRELLEGATTRSLPGRWEVLSKPGLSNRERWRWEWGENGSAVVLYLKRYEAPRLHEQWDRMLRQSIAHSRAYWEFRQAQRLEEASVPAARAIAYVEEMRGRLERRSAVLLEQVPGDAFDRVWCAAERRGAGFTRGAARQDVTVRLARFVAAFHGTGLCHRDLYLCHVFIKLDADGRTPPQLTLIDLARTHRPRWRRTRWLVKDLAQLDASARQVGASRTDRFRFLRAYLGLQRGAPRARWWARRVVRKSDWILRRDARKARRR